MAFRLPAIRIPIQGVDEFTKVMNTTSKRIGSMGQSLKRAGRSMTLGLTLPAVALGIGMMKTAGDFQMSMNRVRAITGASGEQLEQLTGQARQLGATTQYTASQAADSMGNLALAGFKTNEILGAMPGTLQLAAAGQMDLAQASDIAASILRGFGLEAGKLGDVNDVLVATFTNTNTTLEDLGEGMKYVATIARSMSIPVEEVSAAMGILGNVGLKGSMAGTALRGTLSKIANPAREAVAVLNRLGIRREDILDSKGNVKSLVAVVEALERSGAGAADMLAIFGQRAGPGIAGLVGQGSAKLRSMTELVKNSGGIAERVAKIQMEGFNGALRKMISALQEMAIAIADSGILEFMTNLVTKLADVFRRISESNPALLRMGVIAIAVVAAIGPLLMALGQIAIGISLITKLLGSKFLLGVLGKVGVALKSMVLSPVGLIIAAFLIWANVIRLVVEHWENLRDMFTDFKLFKDTLKVIFGGRVGPSEAEQSAAAVTARARGLSVEQVMAERSAAEGTSKTQVDVNFRNAPEGMRPEIISGGNVNLMTELGLLPAGG